MFHVRVKETVEKKGFIEAKDAIAAQIKAAQMSSDEFHYDKVTESVCAVFPVDLRFEVDCEDHEDHEDHDPCDGYYECDSCPNYCEVCGSCAKESDFVPDRGECATCESRCSVCNACTSDDCKELRK